jgi:proton-coupled amino acid transporter
LNRAAYFHLPQFFVFEGSITLLVPLQEAVFAPSDKDRFPLVNVQVTTGIVMFYIFFAMTCWVSFGDSVKTALTASLPEGIMSTVVQFAYSVAVILTFPLQAFPALEVIFHPSNESLPISPLKRNMISSIITILLGFTAYVAIDCLGNVVSLLGSLVGIPIALIFPPLMHNALAKKAGWLTKMMNYIVASLGMVAMGAASYSTIASWGAGAE